VRRASVIGRADDIPGAIALKSGGRAAPTVRRTGSSPEPYPNRSVI